MWVFSLSSHLGSPKHLSYSASTTVGFVVFTLFVTILTSLHLYLQAHCFSEACFADDSLNVQCRRSPFKNKFTHLITFAVGQHCSSFCIGTTALREDVLMTEHVYPRITDTRIRPATNGSTGEQG